MSLCSDCNSFYSNPEMEGLCSSCYKKSLKNKAKIIKEKEDPKKYYGLKKSSQKDQQESAKTKKKPFQILLQPLQMILSGLTFPNITVESPSV